MSEMNLSNTERTTLSYAFSAGKQFDGSHNIPENHFLVSQDPLRPTFNLLVDGNGQNRVKSARQIQAYSEHIVKIVPDESIPERYLSNS